MSKKLMSLKDLLIHQLQDLHSAESQLIKALPKMCDAASDAELKNAFERHLAETEVHVERVEEALEMLDAPTGGVTCEAMKGLVKEGKETIDENATPAVKDAALIAAAQRVEHYEIAGYGTARAYAAQLGLASVSNILTQILDEESRTDENLSLIAATINKAAIPVGAA